MSKISASEVNRLRKMTGSGMMDCKNALVEADGDFDKAIEILRKKGQKVAAKRGDRDASEGLVIAETSSDNKRGVIAVVSCETDFVAKNEEFGEFATIIAKAALENNVSSKDEVKNLPFGGNGISIGEKITEMMGKIGEKIDVSELDIIEADTVVAYNHPGNQIASIVGLNQGGESVESVGRDLAMQIVAMNPLAINEEGISQEVIDKEIEIGKDMARQEGKPEEMLEKIARGKLNKFFKENTLLNQEFIKESKTSVSKYLESVDKNLSVTAFKRHAMK